MLLFNPIRNFFRVVPFVGCCFLIPSDQTESHMANGTITEGRTQLFTFEREARRWELLVRIFYSIAIGIVLFVYGLIAFICMFIQWFVILILGRRNMDLSEFIIGYLEYQVHVLSYTSWMTDTRPGIMPVTVKIFEEKA